MTDTDPTEGMSDAELAAYYDEHGLADFDGGEAVNLDPGPKDSIVSVRFAAGELDAVEQQAEAAGMKLTAYIRASALSGAQFVDLDRLRKVAAKIVADTEEMGKVFGLPSSRSTTRRVAKSAHSGRIVNGSRSGGAKTSKRATSKTASALSQPSKVPTKKAAAGESTARPAKKSSVPKGRA